MRALHRRIAVAIVVLIWVLMIAFWIPSKGHAQEAKQDENPAKTEPCAPQPPPVKQPVEYPFPVWAGPPLPPLPPPLPEKQK